MKAAEDQGPIGHMCNEKSPIYDKAPKPTKATDHQSTNILLGMLCGHVENLVTESNRANEGARRRHDD